jgi:SNF2 family DNA or RNA helicase
MALFGRPNEKLIQTYRDNLKVGLSTDPLPLTTAHLTYRRSKPEGFELPVKSEHVQRPDLTVSALACTPNLSPVCLGEQIDLSVRIDASSSVDLQTPPANLTQDLFLPVDDALVSTDIDACNQFGAFVRDVELILASQLQLRSLDLENVDAYKSFEVLASEVELILVSQLQLRSVDLENFNVVIKRFSFPPVKTDVPTLFGQRRQARAQHVRVGPIIPPPVPPSSTNETLQERLKRILTPPIHEILSDPDLALPERPFPYQTYGIKWLYDRENALLADEMGLGKTMQAIIAARLLWKERLVRQILIVCPKSLIPNWRRELRTWWPGVECYTQVVGQDRQSFLRLATSDVTVKIINYECLWRELDWLKKTPPFHDLIIIDEAQRIKNAQSGVAQAVKAFDAKRRWALTGTPLENSINDLVSLFGFIRPGLISETNSQQRIRDSIAPYMLRRRQEEVLKDLPEKIEQDVPIELGARQREAYDRAERDGVVKLNEMGDSVTLSHVFALIKSLRQICNFEPISGESAKTDLVLEELEEIIDSGRKALIFGYFVAEPYGLRRLAKKISGAKGFRNRGQPLELHGDIPQQQRNAVVELFQNNPSRQLLLANYAIGGVGLNLQAANYVFLFDRWWNPAVEDQAIKRSHRLGQKLPVFAKRLYCKETIEERILQKLAEKRRIFLNVIEGIDDKPANVSLGLSEEEIFSLFNLKVRPRRTGQSAVPVRVVLDNLEPKGFENLVAMIYERDGYNVKVTPMSHDGGIDIWAERISAGGRDVIVVQCKHQKHNVGRPVLQQLWGVVYSDPSVTRCDFVTSAGFSAEAVEFARGKRLTLIDRRKLKDLALARGVAELVDPT